MSDDPIEIVRRFCAAWGENDLGHRLILTVRIDVGHRVNGEAEGSQSLGHDAAPEAAVDEEVRRRL